MAVTFNGQLEINTGQGVKADAPTLRAPKRATPIPKLTEDGQIEQEQGITLRVGLFFDGTGNNKDNAIPPVCTPTNAQYDEDEAEDIVQMCKDMNVSGDREGSYANAASNVARLHGLYGDDANRSLTATEKTASLRVYIEGIGTNSKGEDHMLLGQAMGTGKTGVKSRVEESPGLLRDQLDTFTETNPDLKIERLEFDVFGFSRGSAAARHCVNEILKEADGVFAALWKENPDYFVENFSGSYGQELQINFVGLYDSVAAIVNPLRGDFSTADASNPGLLQYLPPGKINKVFHLRALDECREGFALNRVVPGHQEVLLPGVHSDIGGGYLRELREAHWLTRLRSAQESVFKEATSTSVYHRAIGDLVDWKHHHPYLANHPNLEVKTWRASSMPGGRGGPNRTGRIYAVSYLERKVRGELSLIYLRIMREFAVEYDVPLRSPDSDVKYTLPAELKPYYPKLLAQARDGQDRLSDAEKRILYQRYIHVSAYWEPLEPYLPVAIMKPADNYERIVHAHEPD